MTKEKSINKLLYGLLPSDCEGIESLTELALTTMPTVAKLFSIPRKYYKAGIQRYGFHGLSYSYLIEELSSCSLWVRNTCIFRRYWGIFPLKFGVKYEIALNFWEFELCEIKNMNNEAIISTKASKVTVRVI